MARSIYYVFVSLFIIFSSCKKDAAPPPPTPPNPPPSQHDTTFSLVGYDFILGNLETSTPDTFILQFNKAVSVKYVIFTEDWCLPDLKWEVDQSGKQVRFYNFLCNGIGGEYPFEYSVEDSDGTIITDTIHFNASEKRFTVEGTIRYYWMTPDSRYVWLSTADPHQLLQIDISSGNIVKQFNLPFEPFRFVFNEYNQRFYVLGNYFSDFNRITDKILVINPDNGSIEKQIDLPLDQYDHPASEQVWAYDIAFGDNGLGVVLSGVRGTSAMRWKVLDSRHGDTVYPHSEWVEFQEGTGGNIYFSGFERAFRSSDGKKILMPELYGSARFGELDIETDTIIERIPPAEVISRYNVVALNRFSSDIYCGNLYKQYILDENNQPKGRVSEFDLRGITSVDFSYHANDKNIIYLKVDEFFYMLDYNIAKTKMSCKMAYEVHYIFNTADGKYVVGIADHAVHLFKADMFYRNAQ